MIATNHHTSVPCSMPANTLDWPHGHEQGLLAAALSYAAMGWPVLPCHPIEHRPFIEGGFKNASVDKATIRDWWTRWPGAAIGVRTGEAAGFFAIDIDRHEGGQDGEASLTDLEARHGALPATVTNITGGGGRHLLFRWPGAAVPCSTGKIALGIDVKGDGGYVIVPCSDHKSGVNYRWQEGRGPGEIAIAEAPAWLLSMIRDASPKPQPAVGTECPESIPQGQRNSTLASMAGSMRHAGMDASEIQAALAAINQARCSPPLPDAEIARIATSIGGYAPGPGAAPGGAWPVPQPLPDGVPAVLPFDPDLLPEAFRKHCIDVAERMQCPIEFVAVPLMVGFSSVVGRKIGIRPKRHDDWLVIPNLWGVLIGRPSSMKSPPLREALRPVRRLGAEAFEVFERGKREAQRASEVHAARKTALASRLKGAVKDGGDGRDEEAELLGLEEPVAPMLRRYQTNDTTVEALGQLLQDNPNGVLVCRDELVGLLKYCDREGQESARAFFLEAWDGNGSLETDRIGRGHIRITGMCISLLGTIQPGVLDAYLRAAVSGGVGDDGLMQRFQLAVQPDDPGAWVDVDRWPDAAARNRVARIFRQIDRADGASLGGETDLFDEGGVPFLRFDDEAQGLFGQWRSTLENRLREGGEHPAMEAHLTKYRSLVPSLALLIHLADGGIRAVGPDALRRAIGWAVYLESHARRIYASVIHRGEAGARTLAEHIQQGDLGTTFRKRTVQRKGWAGLTDKDAVAEALEVLVDLGWLRQRTVFTGGRPTEEYDVNPGVLTGQRGTKAAEDGLSSVPSVRSQGLSEEIGPGGLAPLPGLPGGLCPPGGGQAVVPVGPAVPGYSLAGAYPQPDGG